MSVGHVSPLYSLQINGHTIIWNSTVEKKACLKGKQHGSTALNNLYEKSKTKNPYNHEMHLCLRRHFSLPLGKIHCLKPCKTSHPVSSLYQEDRIPVGRKKHLAGRNHFAHLKEPVDQCQRGWRSLAVRAGFPKATRFRQFLTVHRSS